MKTTKKFPNKIKFIVQQPYHNKVHVEMSFGVQDVRVTKSVKHDNKLFQYLWTLNVTIGD